MLREAEGREAADVVPDRNVVATRNRGYVLRDGGDFFRVLCPLPAYAERRRATNQRNERQRPICPRRRNWKPGKADRGVREARSQPREDWPARDVAIRRNGVRRLCVVGRR